MARRATRTPSLEEIRRRREDLSNALEEADAQLKAAEAAARDVGRSTLLMALDRIKIPAMEKSAAMTIATAIAKHGGAAVAEAVARIDFQAN